MVLSLIPFKPTWTKGIVIAGALFLGGPEPIRPSLHARSPSALGAPESHCLCQLPSRSMPCMPEDPTWAKQNPSKWQGYSFYTWPSPVERLRHLSWGWCPGLRKAVREEVSNAPGCNKPGKSSRIVKCGQHRLWLASTRRSPSKSVLEGLLSFGRALKRCMTVAYSLAVQPVLAFVGGLEFDLLRPRRE